MFLLVCEHRLIRCQWRQGRLSHWRLVGWPLRLRDRRRLHQTMELRHLVNGFCGHLIPMSRALSCWDVCLDHMHQSLLLVSPFVSHCKGYIDYHHL